MKDKNYNTFTIMSLIALIGLSFYISSQMSEVKRQSRDAYEVAHELYYKVETLSAQIDQLEKKDQRIQNTTYDVTNIMKDQTALANVKFASELNQIVADQKIMLLYRSSNLLNQEQGADSTEWLKLPVTVHYNQIESEFTLPCTEDYELQLMFEKNGERFFETLPNLDLHTTLDHIFARSIHLHKTKANKIEFDAQVVLFQSDFEVKLDSALCHIYYKDQLQKTYDVIKATEEGAQKEPQMQMEHQDEDFWFVNTSYTFENIQDFNPENVRIELLLTDSFGNEYSTDFDL